MYTALYYTFYVAGFKIMKHKAFYVLLMIALFAAVSLAAAEAAAAVIPAGTEENISLTRLTPHCSTS